MKNKLKLFITANFSQLMIFLAIVSLLLSAISFFLPTLTPPEDLGLSKGITVAERLADLAYFLFLIGVAAQFWRLRRNGKN